MSQFISSSSKKTYKSTTKKSIGKTSGTRPAGTVMQTILPAPSNNAEQDGAVLSNLSALQTRLNESHVLLQQVHQGMESLKNSNGNSSQVSPHQAPPPQMYMKYRLPSVSRLIRSETRNVLVSTPLTMNEGALSSSNRPIADKVRMYIHQQPEGQPLASAVIEEKTRRHISYKLNRANTSPEKLAKRNQSSRRRTRKTRVLAAYKRLHLADRANLESKYGETVEDLLDKEMLSDIESDDEQREYTVYTPSNRHPLVEEYLGELKAQRSKEKKMKVIDFSSCPVESRHIELSKEQKARVAKWIATRQ
ncbi:hypothetical protein INT47_006511 [Mucor saturninus]|uniref:Uncharacterized protein n=1 Tax=Mucor saturninus TaxID=64648 RepID=A0A8H7UM57_9FUNG|nr:hypothetical protein INT47_006511 [Mucor saturninus]